MNDIIIVKTPELTGKRHAFVMREDRIGHYVEFREFFSQTFDLDRIGLTKPGYLQAPSGMVYAFVFLGRSGEPFPSGLDIFALPKALEPLDNMVTDRDLWEILCWMIEGVGPPWTRDDLEKTGRVYRIPACID